MSKVTTHAPGTFCWPELSTSDQRAAEKFYTGLFGWTVSETPMGPDAHYTIFLKDGLSVAAAATLQPEQAKMGVPPNWLSYVSASSVDDSVERAKAAGGTLVAGPFDVMEHGRMAVLVDPVGAAFALWQGNATPGVQLLDAPGSLVWTELMTTDTKKAGAFYAGLFGWRADVMPMSGMDYTVFKRGDVSAGGMMARQPEQGNTPPHWRPYFGVENADATHARALSLGGKAITPCMDIPNIGRFAVLMDPQGAVFSIIQQVANQA